MYLSFFNTCISTEGFRRPLHLYIKADHSSEPQSHVEALPAQNLASSTRLKSVIGGVSKTFSLPATPVKSTEGCTSTEACMESRCDEELEPMQTLTASSGHRLDFEDVFVQNMSDT